MTQVDWSKAPEGANVFVPRSICKWERRNEDGSVDFWDWMIEDWRPLDHDFDTLMACEAAKGWPRILKEHDDEN